MCGIIGILSNKEVSSTIIDVLKKLEYRGYDSAGIATISNNEIRRQRAKGKIENLVNLISQNDLPGTIGIGHTRWATHGIPSEKNAHPHKSNERIYIVHNGIIENHLELKNFLTEKSYQFTSETDSEVIGHLLDYFLNQGNNILDSIYLTKEKLEGAYAIAILDIEDENNIYVARCKSPLLVGQGENENFAASDPLAIGKLANEFIFLEDEDLSLIHI